MTSRVPAAPIAEKPRRPVLVVDDSAVMRAVITRIINAGDGFAVAGAVSDVGAALAFLEVVRVDIILLDINLPGTSGLAALPDLIAAGRGAKVLIVSTDCADGAANTVQALALGAADTLTKPGGTLSATDFGIMLCERMQRLVTPSSRPVAAPVGRVPDPSHGDYDVVAIGASTGGIHAVSRMLRLVPAGFTRPILITQHLPSSFMAYFAAQVAVLADRPCVVAEDGMPIIPGRVVVAPGDAHMSVVRSGGRVEVRLLHAHEGSGCMPSVDPMMASVAQVYGRRALGVMLSGMGRDGLSGARKIVEAGGHMLVQDEETSVVWGMPGTVAAAGLARAVLAPEAIGRVVGSGRRL